MYGLNILSGGIDMGLDFPKRLGFCSDCFELTVGCIVLLFQFCITDLDCFAVVFTVGEILGQQPVGSIELIQFCFMFSLVFLLGFREFDAAQIVSNGFQPLVSFPGIREFLQFPHLGGLGIQPLFLGSDGCISFGNE